MFTILSEIIPAFMLRSWTSQLFIKSYTVGVCFKKKISDGSEKTEKCLKEAHKPQ